MDTHMEPSRLVGFLRWHAGRLNPGVHYMILAPIYLSQTGFRARRQNPHVVAYSRCAAVTDAGLKLADQRRNMRATDLVFERPQTSRYFQTGFILSTQSLQGSCSVRYVTTSFENGDQQ